MLHQVLSLRTVLFVEKGVLVSAGEVLKTAIRSIFSDIWDWKRIENHATLQYELIPPVYNRVFTVSLGCLNSLTQNMDIRPNHTIYINNMNDKIKKEGKCFLKIFVCKQNIFTTDLKIVLFQNFSSCSISQCLNRFFSFCVRILRPEKIKIGKAEIVWNLLSLIGRMVSDNLLN